MLDTQSLRMIFVELGLVLLVMVLIFIYPLNTTYSTWPIILFPYTLHPSLCMKPSSFISLMIILGKEGLVNNIDIYMHPLIHKLKLLRKCVNAFDLCTNEIFTLQAALR